MSDQNLDYAAIRRSVETGLSRQKWRYRILFFLMHLLFFVVTMFAVWGTVAADAQVRDLLFNTESGAAVIVILPTIMWAAVLLFHVASLYIESTAGERAIREKLLMREAGEEILRKGLADEGLLEKPKRRAAVLDAERVRLSDDGERLVLDDDEHLDDSDYNPHSNHAGDKRQF